MGAKKQSSAARRQQIAKAVVRLIARDGYDSLNVATVAKQVGIVPSALYRHFKGKDEMVIYALESLKERMFAEWDSAEAAGASPLITLDHMVEAYPGMLPDILAIPRIVFSSSVRRGGAKLFRYIGKDVMTVFLKRLDAQFRAGQQAGEIRREVDTKMLAMLYWSVVIPTGFRWYLSSGEFDVAEHLNAAWRLIRDSIAVQSTEQGSCYPGPNEANRSKR